MAFKMNRPIIKGTPLQKDTGKRMIDNNPQDLRPNMGGNTLGIKHRGHLDEWYNTTSDKPNFGYTNFEDFKKDWPNAVMEGGVALTFEGGPEYFKKREPEKLIKLPSRSIKQISTPEVAELKKVPPHELVKNKTEYFTTEMKGKRGGTYVKGGDGRSEMNLRDQAGRLVWSGTQAEYEEKYGNFLERGDTEYGERKKHRLYLKE